MRHTRLKTFTLTVAALTLTACQTTATSEVTQTPQEQLFSNISPTLYDGTSATKERKAEDPTCLKFYSNATKYVMDSKTGKDTAMSFAKTIGLGILAGAASGSVASMGISSAFLETAIAGAANQVVYQGGKKAVDKLSAPEAEDPMVKVQSSSEQLGCPPISKATMKASKKAAKALQKEKASEVKANED